jgi:plastocyanin domain-containing protein
MLNATQWLVIFAGVAAIASVNWYFFIAGRSAATTATVTPRGTQEQVITVDGGYTPSVVRVRAGQPVKLVFDRRDTGSCSDEVVLSDFGVRRFLPTGKRTVIEVTPDHAGRYEFTCGMGMLHGALIAEDADQKAKP